VSRLRAHRSIGGEKKSGNGQGERVGEGDRGITHKF